MNAPGKHIASHNCRFLESQSMQPCSVTTALQIVQLKNTPGYLVLIHLAHESGAGHDVGHENEQQVAQNRANARTRHPAVRTDNRRQNKR